MENVDKHLLFEKYIIMYLFDFEEMDMNFIAKLISPSSIQLKD